MNPLDALAGTLVLRPGGRRPHNLDNRRRSDAAPLVVGKPVAAVPGLLGSLFNLCGHAHRLCAELALRAALRGHAASLPDAARALQRETLGEHLRRIGLDWPAALAAPASREALCTAALQSLAACPLLRGGAPDDEAARTWVAQHLLGMPADRWLQRWIAEPGWWADWSTDGDGWLPRLVREARAISEWPVAAAEPLRVHASSDSLRRLMTDLRDGATCQPRWQGRCAETGTWTRLHDAGRPLPATPWHRLGARVAEIVRLVSPDAQGRGGDGWLEHGALQLADGEGVAWVEMARGLLVHHAVVAAGADMPQVAAYRVLAPTDWNFHADGAVARALEGLEPARAGTVPPRVAALVAAYDPCVRFEVAPGSVERESAHA